MDCAGNSYWHEFTKEYAIDDKPLEDKYARVEAKWYRRRLARIAMGQQFIEEAPSHGYTETMSKTTAAVKGFFSKFR